MKYLFSLLNKLKVYLSSFIQVALVLLGIIVSLSTYGLTGDFPDQVDIRDITRSHFQRLHIEDYYTKVNGLVQKQFNCNLLANKNASQRHIKLCHFNNDLTYFDFRMPRPEGLSLFSFSPKVTEGPPAGSGLILFYDLEPEVSKVKETHLSNTSNTILSVQFNPLNNSFLNCMDLESELCTRTALILHGKKLYLKHFLINTQGTKYTISDNQVKPHTEYVSEDVDVSFELGLIDRILTINIESVFGVFKKHYPVSVPGFDFSGDRIRGLTPGRSYYISANDDLSPGAKSFRHRDDKDYFFGLPFIKVLEENRQNELVYAEGVGLHTTPYARPLKRGFVSAGCFRGRPSDLVEWFFIFYSRTKNKASFNIQYDLPGSYHPYPQLNSSYKMQAYEEKRVGKEADPTEMTWVNSAPPIQIQ